MVHQKKLTNTLNRMFSLHPKLIDFDLTRLNLLMNKFGSPHNQLSNVIHIAEQMVKGQLHLSLKKYSKLTAILLISILHLI